MNTKAENSTAENIEQLEELRRLLLAEYKERGVLSDARMIELSQKLDKLIVQAQRGKMRIKAVLTHAIMTA